MSVEKKKHTGVCMRNFHRSGQSPVRRPIRPLRRRYLTILVGAGLGPVSGVLYAATVSAYEAAVGLKSTLEQGSRLAVAQLGVKNGFLGNPAVRVPLPHWLAKAADLKRAFGQGDEVNALIVTINRAAEASAAEASPLLMGAIRSLAVRDAQQVLGAGKTAVTQYFSEASKDDLTTRMLPVVTRSLRQAGLSEHPERAWGQAARLGLNPTKQTLEAHVNAYVVRGLFTVLADYERDIRQDPVRSGSVLLGRVYSAMK